MTDQDLSQLDKLTDVLILGDVHIVASSGGISPVDHAGARRSSKMSHRLPGKDQLIKQIALVVTIMALSTIGTALAVSLGLWLLLLPFVLGICFGGVAVYLNLSTLVNIVELDQLRRNVEILNIISGKKEATK